MNNGELLNKIDGICQDCIYLEKIKPYIEELEEKVSLLNKMNEENYEKYCNELKKKRKAIETLDEYYDFMRYDAVGMLNIEIADMFNNVALILESDGIDENKN